MNIDNFINTCESLMIEYDHDLYLPSSATEGVNSDIARLVRADDVKEARRLISEAKKMGRRKEYEGAIKNLKTASRLIVDMKRKVDNMPEKDTMASKVLGYFTPLFTTLQPAKNSKYGTSTVYTDKLSEDTNNPMKKTIQHRFNLLIHEITVLVKKYEKDINNNG